MKQVAGGAFCGLFDEHIEDDLVEALLAESQQPEKPGLGVARNTKRFDESIERLVRKLKRYLGSRVKVYLESIVRKLLDPQISVRWDVFSNNCQDFCNNLIDMELFNPLVAQPTQGTKVTSGPLYLMSFVCRSGSYERETVKSKYDVPNGLTEEYLLKFRYGRHDESNIIDTLQEYWHDWGAFGAGIYRHQNLFPWDCTEAYRRYPVKCNTCNISKHVWAFPFDSWSIIALHLATDRYHYPPTDRENPGPMSDLEWTRNRLTVLLAQDALLTAARHMVASPLFREATQWLHEQRNPKLDRLKLGGIHRAQPFSHHFEKGVYHHYFVAEWAHLKRDQQIKAYELLRDGRMKKKDVSSKGDEGDTDRGGCGGCGGFGCGGEGGSCAGGCSASCGGGCGSCSAASCGGDGGGCGGGCGGCGGCG